MIEREFSMSLFSTRDDRDAALIHEIATLRAEVARQHDEILRLRMYAPGQREDYKVRMAPHVGPTNFAFFGMADVETDFDTFGHQVANESEALK